jgi:hypothetical protein
VIDSLVGRLVDTLPQYGLAAGVFSFPLTKHFKWNKAGSCHYGLPKGESPSYLQHYLSPAEETLQHTKHIAQEGYHGWFPVMTVVAH